MKHNPTTNGTDIQYATKVMLFFGFRNKEIKFLIDNRTIGQFAGEDAHTPTITFDNLTIYNLPFCGRTKKDYPQTRAWG